MVKSNKKGFTPHLSQKGGVKLPVSLSRKKGAGFTLIEMLIVIAIIAILAAAVIIAINPARQFAEARNSQRLSNVNAVLNSVYQNMVDNNGNFSCAAGDIPTTATAMAAVGGYNICGCLVDTYLVSLPSDPSTGSYTDCTSYNTDYTIAKDAGAGRITVAAPSAELGKTISIAR